jgi:hypothetical protein
MDPVAREVIKNSQLTIGFFPGASAEGNAFRMWPGVGKGNDLGGFRTDFETEQYQVLFRPATAPAKVDAAKVYPAWDSKFAPTGTITAGGAGARTRLGTATTPWTAGECFSLRPNLATQKGDTVELEFPPTAVGQLTATWRMSGELPAAEVVLRFTPKQPGYYSLGYHAPMAAPANETDFLLLPFMLHGHRFPEHPSAMLSTSMPTPLSLVQHQGLSYALMGEPSAQPFEWPSNTNARYALGLRNENGLAQPFIYGPVLGQPGCESKNGEPIEMRFRLWIEHGKPWPETYQRIAKEVFGLKDYRRPTQASLSDTALNLLDLIRDEKASGWNARAKGPWNIESRNTVSHSAPLTYLSYYLLTGDEDIYQRFARPALEYMVSRPNPHFAAEREIWNNYYTHQPMRGPSPLFGARWFAGAISMTRSHTAGFGDYLLNDKGQARVSSPHGHQQPFEDSLALYQLTQNRKWLEEAVTGADKYIAANLAKLPEKDLGQAPFINVSFVPDWEGLLHLYEASGEKRFLDAAAEGARWLLTTLWTQPQPPVGEMTINPGGVYDAQRHLWWWGDRLYRRGIIDIAATEAPPYPPAPKIPERRVESWKVSPVGLGLEQPSTFNRQGPRANILMSTWAPNLLRLAKATGDEAFRTAARNAMIGRFGNYPGYYLDGFTDEYHRPDYPLKGPDVTSLYIHHVPPFAASVLDYLFTDAEVRSNGAVSFPQVRQAGYVWFDNRLFGHAPGAVYGQSAWAWLHRTAATVDTVNVDRVLAEGDGKFHVVLLNQVREPQRVHVHLDEQTLGRSLANAHVTLREQNGAPKEAPLKDGSLELTLPPLGIAAVTLDGVKIDVPTHRVTAPGKLPLPSSRALKRQLFAGTLLEAVGLTLQVPPFTWRDLYVYVTAGLDDCRGARLRYRVGDQAEQTVEAKQFPWEFSVRLPAGNETVTWSAEVQVADGRWLKAE